MIGKPNSPQKIKSNKLTVHAMSNYNFKSETTENYTEYNDNGGISVGEISKEPAKLYYTFANKGLDSKGPKRSTSGSSGLDIYHNLPGSKQIKPGQTVTIETNLRIRIPKDHVGMIFPRSSLNHKGVITRTGVIDSDYDGQLMVTVSNMGVNQYTINKGDKIAQLVLLPVDNSVSLEETQELPPLEFESTRNGGYGSTGR